MKKTMKKTMKKPMKKRCQYCLRLIEETNKIDILEHEANCPDNLENVDEGSSIECGDW